MRRNQSRNGQGLNRDRAGTKKGLSRDLPPHQHTEGPGVGILQVARSPSPQRSLTAVGRFIRAVHAVVVTVTDPDTGDAALGDGTLELVGGTGHLSCRREKGCQEEQQGRQRSGTPFPKKQLWD